MGMLTGLLLFVIVVVVVEENEAEEVEDMVVRCGMFLGRGRGGFEGWLERMCGFGRLYVTAKGFLRGSCSWLVRELG